MDIETLVLSVGINQLADIFKISKENLGYIISSKLFLLPRLKAEINVLTKAKQLLIDNNIPVKSINLKLLTPLLENSLLEEDETLQGLWAYLLANTFDSRKQYDSIIFISILKD